MIDWGWIQRNLSMIAGLLGEHIVLSVVPVLVAFVVSIPLGYVVFRTGKLANAILAVLGVVYSIPSLALFVVMPVILQTRILNPVNIVVALAIYSVALLVRSVVDGLRSVPAPVNSSAAAIGYGRVRRLFRVELPLAMPVIFAGLRVVTVSNIALVSVGALIGVGALGELFTRGLNTGFLTPILVGLVLSLVLALVCDGIILLIQRGVLPWARGAEARMIWSYLLDPANWTGSSGILVLLGQQLLYTVLAVLIAAVVGIPLGIFIGHTGRGTFVGIGLSNAARAIPSLGLLVLVITLLSTGVGPIIAVLAVLALPAILTATAAGISGADHEAVHAARALGMTGNQVIGKVEWPLALPLVISGLRSATLQVVSTATIAGFVAGGGLGQLLNTGQRTANYPQMFAGAVLVALLAVALDLLLGLIGWLVARRTNPAAAGEMAFAAST